MRKQIFVILPLFFFIKGFSQIDNMRIFLGSNDVQVSNYFDSLNSLKPNPAYKIEKGLTADGDLTLKVDFSIYDEQFYKCLAIWAIFQRVNGTEYCSKQLILGSSEYAEYNLAFIKDNFKRVSDNSWEYIPENTNYKYVATLEVKSGDYPSYSILYRIASK